MVKYDGILLGDEICRAVGVNPKNIYRVIVDCKVGNVSRVITHGFAESSDNKIDRMKRVIRHYELKPKEKVELKQ